MPTTALLFFAISQQHHFRYDLKPGQNLAGFVDFLKQTAPKGEQIDYVDPVPPDIKYDFSIKNDDFETTLYLLSALSPIRWLKYEQEDKKTCRNVTHWYLSWSGGDVAKGHMRIFKQSGSFNLAINEVKISDVVKKFEDATTKEWQPFFQAADIDLTQAPKDFVLRPRTASGDEKEQEFILRLIPELRKALAAAKPPTTAEATTAPDDTTQVRAVWNVTLNPSDPISLGGTDPNIDFKQSSLAAKDLALAIDTAWNSDRTAEDKSPKKVTATAVDDKIVLYGQNKLVQEIRRLLATELDVPKSQVKLELDTYQVSANVKSQNAADVAVRKFELAQQIGRAYKLAHIQAVKLMVMGLDKEIQNTIRDRSTLYGLDVPKLFHEIGFEPTSKRLLGQTEMLTMLAYCPENDLNVKWPKALEAEFNDTKGKVYDRIITPLLKSSSLPDQALGAELKTLNEDLADQKGIAKAPFDKDHSPYALLRTFAEGGDDEDQITRHAVEEFFLLWLATADSVMSEKIRGAEYETPGKDGVDPVYALLRSAYSAGDAVDKAGQAVVRKAVDGDRPAKLSRSGARLDDLLAVGVEALQADSNALVDAPLKGWIDNNVVTKNQNSTFGVRNSGTTKLALSSRAPALTGVETLTYFPSQPVSPIDLAALVPLLARKQVAPTATDTLATAGLTPLETTLLNGVFSQAAQPPYYREIGTGLHLSVFPTMLANGSATRLQLKLSMGVTPDSQNKGGAGTAGQPGPVDLVKTSVVQTELLANAFDIVTVSSLQLNVSAPSKRDWEVPVLSQILPIRSWFVGPTQDKTVRHEALVLVKVTILPRAMDLASRFLNSQPGSRFVSPPK